MDIELYREKYFLIKCQYNKSEEIYSNCVEAKLLAEETLYDIYKQVDYIDTNLKSIEHLWTSRNLTGNINYITENNYTIFSNIKNSTSNFVEKYDEIDKYMRDLLYKQELYMEELKSLNNEFNREE